MTPEEKLEVVTNCDHLSRLRFSPVLPFAFTEHGVLMLANITNSKRAVRVSVQIIRTFVRLRKILSTHAELAQKLTEMEKKGEVPLCCEGSNISEREGFFEDKRY